MVALSAGDAPLTASTAFERDSSALLASISSNALHAPGALRELLSSWNVIPAKTPAACRPTSSCSSATGRVRATFCAAPFVTLPVLARIRSAVCWL